MYVENEIKGKAKYTIAAVLFGALGILISVKQIVHLFQGEHAPFLLFGLGAVFFAFILWKIRTDVIKTNIDLFDNDEGVVMYSENYKGDKLSRQQMNKIPLFVGYLATWLGGSIVYGLFFIEDTQPEDLQGIVLGYIFFILGLPVFISSFIYMIKPCPETQRIVDKMVKLVTWIGFLLGLLPVLLIIAGLLYNGYYWKGAISLTVLILLIVVFIKIKYKQNK